MSQLSSRSFRYFYMFLFSLLIVLSLLTSPVKGQDDEEEEEPERTCQQYIFGLVQKLMPEVPKCLSGTNRLNLRFRQPMEMLSRAYCIVKCLLSQLEVLDEKGSLDEVNALFFFQDNIPPHVLPAVVEVAGPCLEMASTLVPSQYYCQSYGPFTECLVGALVKGLAPWAIDCFGTPAFAGVFGFLKVFVPPLPPVPAGRRITISTNTTLLLQRMKILKRQRHLEKLNGTGAGGGGSEVNSLLEEVTTVGTTTTMSTTPSPIATARYTTTIPSTPASVERQVPPRYYYRDYFNNRSPYGNSYSYYSPTSSYSQDNIIY